MKRQLFKWDDIAATAHAGIYVSSCGGSEYHVMINLNDRYADVEKQFASIETSIERIKNEYRKASLIFKRYFVSDAVNQIEYAGDGQYAVSVIEQPPANGTKAAAWLYLVDDCKVYRDGAGGFVMERFPYRHFFDAMLNVPALDETLETRLVFENYVKTLESRGCSLFDNCIRTWIFIHGIDTRYAGMASERRIFFEREGLLPDTHYIASTGIEGRRSNPKSTVIMDAYSVKGIDRSQVKHIKAPAYLNDTCEYGVTFERATSVEYGDRKHVFVSGTASINSRGEIVYPKNVTGQLERIFENIEALLCSAETGMDDIAQMTVYLRDMSDYSVVEQYIENHVADVPCVTVKAAVCRPGWLVEIECIAVRSVSNKNFSAF